MVDHNKVEVDAEDVEYIVRQLNTAISRANSRQRLGSHMIKRLRKSKAILLTRLEEMEEKNKEFEYELSKPSKNLFVRFLEGLFGK